MIVTWTLLVTLTAAAGGGNMALPGYPSESLCWSEGGLLAQDHMAIKEIRCEISQLPNAVKRDSQGKKTPRSLRRENP